MPGREDREAHSGPRHEVRQTQNLGSLLPTSWASQSLNQSLP